MHFAAAALVLILERLIGYPMALHRALGHPVEWMGRLIAWLDRLLNRSELPRNRLRGIAALFVLLIAAGGVSFALAWLLRVPPFGWILEAVLATPFLAQKSLRDHVEAVADGLDLSLDKGRDAVSLIVGRDPQQLDASGISHAALESLAENTSDGVVAPIFWFLLFGLPGIVLYKAINTADSMIGHRSSRYLQFGWAAAHLDDLVNLPCSRLTGLIFAAAAASFDIDSARTSLRAMWRDAGKHQSPNAGWPEAALAGALGVRLGGERSYDGETVNLATMGGGKERLGTHDIRRGLRLYGRALNVLFVLIALAALLFSG